MPLTPDQHQAFADAVARLAGPADSPDRAQLLAVAAHTVTGAGAVAVIFGENGGIEAAAGSDEVCHRLAENEQDTGPRTDAERSRAAAELGRSLVCTVPLSAARADAPTGAGSPALGALVLVAAAGAPPATDVDWAAVLAAVTAGGLLQQRTLARERRTAQQLTLALESRVIVEQAKGVLAERGCLDPDTAFDRLRRFARAHRRPLREVARDVVRGAAADAVLSHVRPPGRQPGGL